MLKIINISMFDLMIILVVLTGMLNIYILAFVRKMLDKFSQSILV